MRRPVVFLYPFRSRGLGSTVMRGGQLSRMYRALVAHERAVSFVPLEIAHPRNSIVILTKAAGLRASVQTLSRLRRAGCSLVFDPVDGVLPGPAQEFATTVLAASLTSADALTKANPSLRVETVLHHVDPRVEALALNRPTGAHVVRYFGELFNTFETRAIHERVEFVRVPTNRRSSSWLRRLAGTTLHYAIRQRLPIDFVKPFTKGFTAAHTGAAILVQDSEAEAVRWLGVDYPYLLRGPVTEASIIGLLDRVASEFGTVVFDEARDRVAALAAPSAGRAVARQLDSVVRSLD